MTEVEKYQEPEGELTEALEKPIELPRMGANLMALPTFTSAHTALSFMPNSLNVYKPDIVSMHSEFKARCTAVVDGDMAYPEAILASQAMSLNAIYNECASQAGASIATSLPKAEVLLRMALKAQAQCAQTLRVLGELKNPRPAATFVKQQNNAAGNQQVNNGPVTQGSPARAHGEKETVVTTNELLTDDTEAQHAATLDAGATSRTSREDQKMEAVGVGGGSGD